MSLAILFPGQGTQYPDMLPWLDAADATSLAPLVDAFGPDWRARFADVKWTQRNEVAQPLITGLCVSAWNVMAPLLPHPTVVIGYSVGELASFHAAGVFGAHEAMVLSARRAALMDASAQGSRTGLLSITGVSLMLVERLCQTHDLDLAIRLAPDRVLVGGEKGSLEAAAMQAAALGASVCTLAISVASHTRWMRGAVAPFAAALKRVAFAPPHVPLVTDRNAGVVWDVGALRSALAEQMAEAIRWDDCMDAVAERGIACALEVGPGFTLSRLWNARYPSVPARSVDEFKTPEAVVRWVAAAMD